ncbi:MAG TPA: glycosyltransferase family 87 protein [Acidimicrobiales bacterium]|jgi:arabinofuranan 3-O-arabinosyltransferase|nr:glycosyltransferase family 87 protein [Acidimicrobiales bacterium]
MPSAVVSDSRGAPKLQFSPADVTASSASASSIRRWQTLRALPSYKVGACGLTVALWVTAAVSWTLLCIHVAKPNAGLGWDFVTSWRATVVFAHGGQPYLRSKTAGRLFLYPPSSLLLMRPIAWFDLRQIQLIGLVVTAVAAWVSVMASVALVGRRWYGPTAALLVWALHYTRPLVAELSLQNATILCLLALIAFYFLTVRDHWTAAAVVIGLSMSLKPLLIVLLLLFLVERKWKALAVSVAIPAALNAVAFVLVKDPAAVFRKLPSLVNRSGVGVHANFAWVDVLRAFAVPDAVVILVRLATIALALGGAWLAWKRLPDPVLRVVATSTALLLGSYLAGTLSEIHYMLTLIPFAIAAVLSRSPMRWVPAWVGIALTMGLIPPATWLGYDVTQNQSIWMAFGMTIVLLTIVLASALEPDEVAPAPVSAVAAVAVEVPARAGLDAVTVGTPRAVPAPVLSGTVNLAAAGAARAASVAGAARSLAAAAAGAARAASVAGAARSVAAALFGRTLATPAGEATAS